MRRFLCLLYLKVLYLKVYKLKIFEDTLLHFSKISQPLLYHRILEPIHLDKQCRVGWTVGFFSKRE
jgi:hypothetical protein